MKLNELTVVALCLTGAVTIVPAQDRTTPARPPYAPEQIFKFWDKNGDGKLTPDEVPNANLFKMLDKNGDGVVSKDEAAAIEKWGAGQPGVKPWAVRGAPDSGAVRGSPDPAPDDAVRGSPDPAPGTTDRSHESGRPAVGGFGEVSDAWG